MKFLLISILLLFMTPPTATKLDFGKKKFGSDWLIINDGVMGGLSQGEVAFTNNSVIFKGRVSLENNGGFSSFRSPYGSIDLSKFTSVKMRVRTNGSKFGFTLSTDTRFYIPNYKKVFSTEAGQWKTFTFQLRDFDQYRIGRATGNKIPEEYLSKIIRMGFITNFKAEKDFSLEIDYLEFK
ncbi:hypothetical protein BKI52_09400 [marine bacterium AO1-C]|nr:hypothetical protein BKI52_09400 [marine bacterium AO1-C]